MGVTLAAGPASARASAPAGGTGDDPGLVRVVKVSGLIDPIVASFLTEEIASADAAGVTALVLQINSGGAVVSDAVMDDWWR